MKCNLKGRQIKQNVDRLSKTLDTVKRLWEMATLLALIREFGFGVKRLKRFSTALQDVYSEIDARASATDMYDKHNRKMTNIDVAIIKVIKELRAAGIDHREILGDDEKLVIFRDDGTERDIDDFLDDMERRERDWRESNE